MGEEMSNSINVKNQRQLHKMQEQLEILQNHSEWLREIVDNLTFLRDALDCMNEYWVREFNTQLLNLESLACATQTQILNMGESYDYLRHQAIQGLKNLVSEALADKNNLSA